MLQPKRFLLFLCLMGFEHTLLSHWSMFTASAAIVPTEDSYYPDEAQPYDLIQPKDMGLVRRTSEIQESPQDTSEESYLMSFSQKRESDVYDSLTPRDTRDPRLRFVKKDAEDNDNIMEREIRDPRLRFVKKEPRLRFVKREHLLSLQKRETVPLEDSKIRSRKKRSVESLSENVRRAKRRLSVNNDMQVIADRVLREKYLQRQQELQNLRDAIRAAGKKRSADMFQGESFTGLDAIKKRTISFTNDMQVIQDIVLREKYEKRQRALQNLMEAFRAGKFILPEIQTDYSQLVDTCPEDDDTL